MRSVLVATLLLAATTAAAHGCEENRGCSGINNRLGVCTASDSNVFKLCAAYSHANYDYDAILPVDRGCVNIQPAFLEVRDNNGTTTLQTAFGPGSNSGTLDNVMSWNCGVDTEEDAWCTKASESNFTYARATLTKTASSRWYVDRSSIVRTCGGLVAVSAIIPRQSAKLYYGADREYSVSSSRGSGLLGFYFDMSCSAINSEEKVVVLFRITNGNADPTKVSFGGSASSGYTANGITFLEKAVKTVPTNVLFSFITRYTRTWANAAMEVVERYEQNPDTWLYEKHQFLAVTLDSNMLTAGSNVQMMAKVGVPAMDGGVSSVATVVAALIAAVAAMLVVA